MATTTKHYYEAVEVDDDRWQGVVYHWDESGKTQIFDYKGPFAWSENDATCDVVKWMEENEIDAELA